MANLFIIGNGFDQAHGLKTSYENFHEYLEEKYPNAKSNDIVPEYVLDGHGEDVPVNEDEVIGFIEYLLNDVDGDKWSDLESSIGEIEFENYMNNYPKNDDDDDEWHEMYFNEDNAMSLVNPILQIPEYFSKWILEIETKGVIPLKDFAKIINRKDDLFLSFNYTKTLEDIYKVKNICHIHGVQGENLLFGHGNDYDYLSEENYGRFPGADVSFQKMQDSLRKNTSKALNKNINFFKMCNLVDCIYSYGFSFSEVDEIYIKEICNRLDTRLITWYFNDYDAELIRDKYKDIILKCGFKGVFGTYHININNKQ